MMFVVCGLNHKTAPINVREKVASSLAIQDYLLHSLLNLPEINEAAILSTCNRMEITAIPIIHELLFPGLHKHINCPLNHYLLFYTCIKITRE